jgi:hypothetical protein
MTTVLRTPAEAAPSRSLLRWWGDRSIKTKILANVGIAAVVAGSIGIVGMNGMSQAADDSALLYSSNLLGSVKAADMRGLLSEMRVTARDALLADTPELTAETYGKLDDIAAMFE